jgi:hypothetical protein
MIGPVLFATSALEFPFFRRCTASIFWASVRWLRYPRGWTGGLHRVRGFTLSSARTCTRRSSRAVSMKIGIPTIPRVFERIFWLFLNEHWNFFKRHKDHQILVYRRWCFWDDLSLVFYLAMWCQSAIELPSFLTRKLLGNRVKH